MSLEVRTGLLPRIAAIGADPADTDEIALQRTLLVGFALICTVAGVFWGLVYIAAGAQLAGAAPLAFSIVTLVSTLAFAKWRNLRLYRFVQLALILVLPWLMMMALGGFHNSSAVILWSGLCPLGALLFHEIRDATLWFLAFLAVLTAAALAPSTPAVALAPEFVTFFYVMNIAGVLAIAFALLSWFVRQTRLFRERSEMLLLSLLPQEIADRLKGEPATIAEHYEEASILFADAVEFTPLSSALEPLDLVELLDEVFLCFDQIVEAHDVEKIKTIGDCYMVAAGVPRRRPDHAEVLARVALEMQAAVAGRTFRGRRLAFRIGINSGPVVAGVIGRRKFIYDLWGDAVNIASRMETQGVSGATQITRATWERIRDTFVCEPAGIIDVKGKGEMEVWHVVGERPGADAAAAEARAA